MYLEVKDLKKSYGEGGGLSGRTKQPGSRKRHGNLPVDGDL